MAKMIIYMMFCFKHTGILTTPQGSFSFISAVYRVSWRWSRGKINLTSQVWAVFVILEAFRVGKLVT
jgi:hypothetical protein